MRLCREENPERVSGKRDENMDFPYEKDNKERIPLEHYLSEYRNIDPKEAAER